MQKRVEHLLDLPIDPRELSKEFIQGLIDTTLGPKVIIFRLIHDQNSGEYWTWEEAYALEAAQEAIMNINGENGTRVKRIRIRFGKTVDVWGGSR